MLLSIKNFKYLLRVRSIKSFKYLFLPYWKIEPASEIIHHLI